ncbi:tetratricopeptide repeat protein [Roseivirga sp. E12]|uniref:tetratricopeptide repeat protein n=1 Tax=Roseivirga sp. E12 TaxID=2819237 RepID=UPI001ABD16E2|nr:tetratricopeptide repeat protein [Roseivirga sp. E12]MBO3697330.1 tetratricopeptide repeat protein [Roseivirga sp. E12]
MRKITFLLTISLFALGSLNAQNTLHQNNENRYYRFGLELLDKHKFSAAREQFERYLNEGNDEIKKADAEYYVAYCALNLENPDGTQLIADFVAKRPNHPKAAKAYYNLGVNAFEARDWQTANKYLKLANVNVLNNEERSETNFKIGYSAFSLNKKEESIEYFDLAKVQNSPYYADANYYSGFLAYLDKNYDKVLVDLKRAEESDKYKFRVPIMITSAYFQQSRYGEVLAYAGNFKDIATESRRMDYLYQIYQLAAESAYNQERFEESIEFYDLYRQIAGQSITDETLYRIAYSNFVLGNGDKAIEDFKRVALKEDTVAQLASYYLGQLYVENENYLFASSAFDKASKLSFNTTIQEESAFNFAKVNFEAKKYSQAIVSLDRFIKQFPASSYIPEANNLLSEAFLNTNDFQRAIAFIERIENKTDRIKEAYQKVTFYKGTEYYNTGKYKTAIQLFDKSLTYRSDKDLETGALFWKAEAQATSRSYAEAIRSYQKVFETRNRNSEYYLKANYGVGYVYYNTQDYSRARVYLKRYVDALQNEPNRLNYDDAILRLADCYYVDKEYATAISYYQRAIDNNNPNVDYAYFQKGVVRDFQNKSTEAIQALDVVINRHSRSRYYDDAIYKKAQIQLEANSYRESIIGFTRVIEKLQQSPFIPYAYESRALAYFNLNELDKAEEDYKTILNNYVTSKVANSALLGLQNTLKLNNKVLEFDQYLAKYRGANPDNQSLETIELEAAKNKYYGQEYSAAIGAFEDYEKNYSESPLRHQAKFFRAESYFRLEDADRALELYYELDREAQINDMDVVFQRIGQLQLQAGDFQEAANYFSKLESIARSKRQENDAWIGLLDANFKLGNYAQMRTYANNILTKGNISQDATNRAQLYLAKAAYSEGNFDEAIDQLLTTINASKDKYGAEAQYLLGQIFFQQKRYQESLNTLFEFSESFADYEDWLGKAFLLVADNYIALEELFQAKATVNSIIENSPIKEVVDEARVKLTQIEKLEKDLEQVAAQDTTQNKGGNQ